MLRKIVVVLILVGLTPAFALAAGSSGSYLAKSGRSYRPSQPASKGEMLYYDDGSFEDALGIYSEHFGSIPSDSTIGIAAFFIHQACSLQAVSVYLDYRTSNDFYLWVWADSSGVPKSGGTPVYFQLAAGPDSGYVGWWTVDIEPSVPVPDTFWVGIGYSYLGAEPEWYIGYDTGTEDNLHFDVNLWGTVDKWENLCDPYGNCHPLGIRPIISSVAIDHDVGLVSIDAPPAQVCPNMPCTPKVTVTNLGSYFETFDVKMTISPGYTSTRTITDLDPVYGDTVQISFDPWTSGGEGTLYQVTVTVELPGDENSINDTLEVQTLASGWQFYDDGGFESGVGFNVTGTGEIPSTETWGFATIFPLPNEELDFVIDTIAIYFSEFNDDGFRLYVWKNDPSCPDQPQSHGTPLYNNMYAEASVGWNYYPVNVFTSSDFWIGVCYNRKTLGSPLWEIGLDTTTFDQHTKVNLDGTACSWYLWDQQGYPEKVRAHGIRVHRTWTEKPQFIRGDYDGSGQLLTNDPLMELQWIFGVPGATAPTCMDAADYSDDGGVLTNDPLMALQYIFGVPGSTPPPPPYPDCGIDPTEDELDCVSHPFCMGGGKEITYRPAISVPGAKERVVVGEAKIVDGLVEVPIDLVVNDRVCGFDISLGYDASTLRFIEVVGGDGYDFYAVDTREEGIVRIGGVPDIEMVKLMEAGTHKVGVVVFEVKREADVVLSWRKVEVYGSNVQLLPVEWVNGVVRVGLPTKHTLESNYPNPFNSATLIRYHLPAISHQLSAVSLKVYNIMGEEVKTLVDGEQKAGSYQVVWDGKDSGGKPVASGIYFCRLKVLGDRLEVVKTRKMVLLR